MKSLKNTRKYIYIYIIAFVLTVAIALGLLFVSAWLPQSAVDHNVYVSAEQLNGEVKNKFGDYSIGTTMSWSSEAIMLMTSKKLDENHLENLLSNYLARYDGVENGRERLLLYASGVEEDYTVPYSRYWMGFRVVLRLLLQKLNYFQIRRFSAYTFFALLFAVLCSLTKNLDARIAFFFGLSMISINPHVIGLSLQNVACFLIAFTAMLLIPRLSKFEKWEPLFFMEVAMVTMYFDFYTNPVVTFGFPMIYLYLYRWKQGRKTGIRHILRNATGWLGGYGGMWIAKLVLTSCFTQENAIAVGLKSFASRTKLDNNEAYAEGYDAITALRRVMVSVVSDQDGKEIFLLSLVVLAVAFGVAYRMTGKPLKGLLCHGGLVLILGIPLVWIAIASQPVVIHSHFQYRIIAVSFWAALSWMYLCLQKHELK